MNHSYPTFTADSLQPAQRRTFYFIGVTTSKSSIRQIFPLWAEELGLGEVDFVGIDLQLHAPPEEYRKVVRFFRDDALSIGALVTTHKLDLYQAASDLFDYADPLTVLMDEISCISKRDGQLRAHAKDPITAGFAVDAILPPGTWAGRSAFIMGAGGSAIAIAWHLTRPERGSDVPAEIVVSNRSRARLESLAKVYAQFGTKVPLRLELSPQAADNDAVLTSMPARSFIVNATGLGKDAPGSPLSDACRFPYEAHTWELNYRGNLVFLDQAQSQAKTQSLDVHDGWVYFLHGWTRVIAEVFDVQIQTSGPEFERLGDIAHEAR